MSIIEIILIAASLCFDTLAVSLAGGACMGPVSGLKRLKIVLTLALVQGSFILLGWFLGSTVVQYIDKFDHWVAFLLLLYIGGKMVFDSFHEKEGKQVNLLKTGQLIVSAVATSIDALAVGVSFAFVEMSVPRALSAAAITGILTAVAAIAGLLGGERMGRLLGSRSNLVGGLILIAIGVKILLEHLLV